MLYYYDSYKQKFFTIDLDGTINPFEGIPYFKYPTIIDRCLIYFRNRIFKVSTELIEIKRTEDDPTHLGRKLINDPTDKYKILFYRSFSNPDKITVINFRYDIIKITICIINNCNFDLLYKIFHSYIINITLHKETYLPLYKPYSKNDCDNIYLIGENKIEFDTKNYKLYMNDKGKTPFK